MTFQFIQTVNRDGKVSIDEFEINGKLLLTPNAFLGIRSNANRRIDIDMNVVKKLMNTIENRDSIAGFYFPLEHWLNIRRKMDYKQRFLIMNEFINERIFLLPSVEALYYGPDNRMERQLNLLSQNYPSIRNYYKTYRTYLGAEKSNPKKYINWVHNLHRDLRNYVFDFLRFQHDENSLFLIPPTPPIFDLDQGLDIAERTFQIGKDFISATYEDNENSQLEPLSLFLPLSINTFNTYQKTIDGTEKLERLLNNLKPNIVLIKIFDESRNHRNIINKLKSLGYFCRAIRKYCKKNKTLSGFLDTIEFGRILLYSGINFVGIPVNNHSHAISLGGSKTGPPPRKEWKVIYPDTRDEIPFSNYQHKIRNIRNRRGFVQNQNPLPHLNELRRIYNEDNIQNLSRTEQIEFSKLLRLVLLSNDVKELKDAIIDMNVRNIIARFSRNPSNYAVKVRTLLNED